MRRTFAACLLEQAKKNKDIVLVTMDLGYGMFNQFREELPDQFYNVGASEQAGLGISVGLAMQGKIVFAYSITPFLLYRPFETIRNYISREGVPVKLIGSGRDKCYAHDGFSHWVPDDRAIMSNFPAITSLWPETKEEIPALFETLLTPKPFYLNLKR